MVLTSAELSKILSKYQDDLESHKSRESESAIFIASLGEDVESVRPAYDYAQTQKEIFELEAKIRKIKHVLNVFNASTLIPEFNITIDEMLVYMPQLSARVNKLKKMSQAMPKTRYSDGYYGRSARSSSPIIDYIYTNYDIEAVKADYAAAYDELSRAQLALDAINHKEVLEIEI